MDSTIVPSENQIYIKYWFIQYCNEMKRITEWFVWGSSTGAVSCSRWARDGGAGEEEVSGCVTLSTGGRLPLPAVNTLIWKCPLKGAPAGRRAREWRLQRNIEEINNGRLTYIYVYYSHFDPILKMNQGLNISVSHFLNIPPVELLWLSLMHINLR